MLLFANIIFNSFGQVISKMSGNFLFQRIDNSQIVVWRIFFGILMLAEGWGPIATGWVKETFVDAEFTFSFIGFEWTHFLLGETMYYVYVVLGLLGLMIALGAFYKVSSFLFAVGWSLVYFMQKEHYNNHYYLIMLVAWFMVFIPANRYKSIDVLIWPKIRTNITFYWTRLIFILQLFIVYTFAALAKLYPGWLNGDFLMLRYKGLGHWVDKTIEWQPLTDFVYSREFAQIISWTGFWFDLLIVPLLLWKKTRIPAILAALVFHLINSFTLHIGIFPYFALAISIFFFPPETIQRLFFRKKTSYQPDSYNFQPSYSNRGLFSFVFVVYFLWQIYLPLRHWMIPGDVLWTEEGHRLSWRMMLRTKSGAAMFTVKDKNSGEIFPVNLYDEMTPLQASRIATHPDMIWQFAQRLKKKYAAEGKQVSVHANVQISINGSRYYQQIDPSVDLAMVKWKYFGHQEWLLESPVDFSSFSQSEAEKN